MTWDTLTWTAPAAAGMDGLDVLGDLGPMLASAMSEAASAQAKAPIDIAGVTVATVDRATLPADLAALATFELLGTPRRAVWAGLHPEAGSTLAAGPTSAEPLGLALLEALDEGLTALVGDGLNLGPADAAVLPAGDILLVRMELRGADGTGVDLVAALEPSVPLELATHVTALQALGPNPAATSGAAVTPITPIPAPVAVPAAAGQADAAEPPANVRPLRLEPLPAPTPIGGGHNIDLLLGVNLQVTVEIGRTRLPIREVLALTPGSIVELDKLAGEKVDVLVNGRQIASGEVVVVDDNFGVRITDVVSRQRRILTADGAA